MPDNTSIATKSENTDKQLFIGVSKNGINKKAFIEFISQSEGQSMFEGDVNLYLAHNI